jgi:hypothetical protein
VSSVGLDEQKIRAYIRDQEQEDKRQERLPLGGGLSPFGRQAGSAVPFMRRTAPRRGLHQAAGSAGGTWL